MNFDQAFDRLLGHEGGYSNNPADPGGETNWGITVIVARANGYVGPMRDLPKEKAKEIYRKLYWDNIRADDLPESIRFDVFDGAVNSGCKQSVKWLQQALKVTVDGIVGAETIAAACMASASLSAKYNGARLKYMTDLSTWANFSKGWARRIAANLIAGE